MMIKWTMLLGAIGLIIYVKIYIMYLLHNVSLTIIAWLYNFISTSGRQ